MIYLKGYSFQSFCSIGITIMHTGKLYEMMTHGIMCVMKVEKSTKRAIAIQAIQQHIQVNECESHCILLPVGKVPENPLAFMAL